MAEAENENIAVKAAHGSGKTVAIGVAGLHFLTLRMDLSEPDPGCIVVTTAPTFNKQVKDVLWANTISAWWRQLGIHAPWLASQFELQARPGIFHREISKWYAVGIASSDAVKMEGYHARHVLVLFDEAKGVGPRAFESVHGMRTTQDVLFVVASTPGGVTGEFHRVITRGRATWRRVFSVHPEQVRAQLEGRLDLPLAKGRHPVTGEVVIGMFSKEGGAYFTTMQRPGWAAGLAEEWGVDSSAYIARVLSLFPSQVGDELYPYPWIARAEDMEEGIGGATVVACDVARFGRDRTIAIVMRGGTAVASETIASTLEETTAAEAHEAGIGPRPRKPSYRETLVVEDMLVRLRQDHNADLIAVDEGTFGAGICDHLRARGERVEEVAFGSSPTDKPKDEAEAERRRRLGLRDSDFVNLKAQMAKHLRDHLQDGNIALGLLPEAFMRTLSSQMSRVSRAFDVHERMRVIDPDQQEGPADLPDEEGKRSPDHFHALIIGVWKSCPSRNVPRAAAGKGSLPPGIKRAGEPTGRGAKRSSAATTVTHAAAGRMGGQGTHVSRMYRR